MGRPRDLTVEAFVVVQQLVGDRQRHASLVVEYVRVLNSLTREQLALLGMRRRWDKGPASYKRFDDLYNRCADLLDEGFRATVGGKTVWVDDQWVADRIVEASILPTTRRSRTLVADGTAVESWGRMTVHDPLIDDDENLTGVDPDMPEEDRPKPTGRRRALVQGHTDDGRKLHTKDWFATGGHRTANGQHPAGGFVGQELFVFTQARDMRRGGGLGDPVAGVVVRFVLAQAGSHRNLACIPQLEHWRETGEVEFDEFVVDRGHTYLDPTTLHYRMRDLGVDLVMDLHEYQRGSRPNDHLIHDVIWVDGAFFDRRMPDDLIDIEPHRREDTADEKREKLRKYEEREFYRWEVHGTTPSGMVRLISPWERGKLWSKEPAFRKYRRGRRKNSRQAWPGPAAVPPPTTITVKHEHSKWLQKYPYGTQRWLDAYNRRQTAESSFSGSNHWYSNVARRGWNQTFGRAKKTLAVAVALAGYNRWVQRTFDATRAKDEQAEQRAKGLKPSRRATALSSLVHDEYARRLNTIRRRAAGEAAEPEREPGGPP